MNDKTERITRKSSTPIKVYCLPEEKEQIEAGRYECSTLPAGGWPGLQDQGCGR